MLPIILSRHQLLYLQQVLGGDLYLAEVAENHVKEYVVGDVHCHRALAVLNAEYPHVGIRHVHLFEHRHGIVYERVGVNVVLLVGEKQCQSVHRRRYALVLAVKPVVKPTFEICGGHFQLRATRAEFVRIALGPCAHGPLQIRSKFRGLLFQIHNRYFLGLGLGFVEHFFILRKSE